MIRNEHNSRKNNMNSKGEGYKKKNTVLLIDGENINYKKAEDILSAAKKEGVLDGEQVRVYARQKDPGTKGWTEKAKELGIRDIRLYGGPEKNKVDNKIQKDISNIVKHRRNIDIFIIASSDADYIDSIKNLRKEGKRVIVIGETKASAALREAANKFIEK